MVFVFDPPLPTHQIKYRGPIKKNNQITPAYLIHIATYLIVALSIVPHNPLGFLESLTTSFNMSLTWQMLVNKFMSTWCLQCLKIMLSNTFFL